MKFLTISVVASFLSCIVFAIVCFAFIYMGYEVSDALIEWFFKVFGVEFAAAAAIQITKYFINKKEREDKIEKLKENNLPVEHDDITKDAQDDDYYDNGTVYG